MTRINEEEIKRAVQVINEGVAAVLEQGGRVIVYPWATSKEYGMCVTGPIKITFFIPLETGEEPKNEQHG